MVRLIGLVFASLLVIDLGMQYNLPVRRPDVKVTVPDGRQGMIVSYKVFGWVTVNVPAKRGEAPDWQFEDEHIPRHWITCHRWQLK